MNRIKKMWDNNRVMFVLGIIVIICVFIILGVMVSYFFGTSSSSYGDRLESIASVPFTEEDQEKIKNAFSKDYTSEVLVSVKGKIVYVIARYNGKASLVAAQNEAVSVYSTIDSKYKTLYDFNFTVVQEETEEMPAFTMMGSKNVSSDSFVWSNNTVSNDGE